MTAANRPPRPNITFTWEFIDGPLAEAYFQQRHPEQRKVRPHRITQYERDLRAGHWTPTNETIGFDEDGYLVDGQHRLRAIANTGIGVWVPVARGLPKKAMSNIGNALPRGATDALRMSGVGDYPNTLIATAHAMYAGPGRSNKAERRMTRIELAAFVEKHREALEFAENGLARINGVTRGVRAVVARAYETSDVSRERLNEWCAVLRNGMPVSAVPSEDSAAIVYRELLRKRAGYTGQELESERYGKGQTALQNFLNRTPMTKIYGTDEDLYPIPDSMPKAKAEELVEV